MTPAVLVSVMRHECMAVRMGLHPVRRQLRSVVPIETKKSVTLFQMFRSVSPQNLHVHAVHSFVLVN